MKRDVFLVYQAPWDWDFLWNRSQPLATALSQWCKVVYLDNGISTDRFPFTILSRLPVRRRSINGVIQIPSIKKLSASLYRCQWYSAIRDPHYIVTRDRPLIAYALLKRKLEQLRKSSGELWLLTSRPAASRLLSLMEWDRIIVDLEDPWFSLNWGKMLDESQTRQFIARADIIFANGPGIAKEYERIFRRSICSLPNGVDKKFLDALALECPIPQFMTTNRLQKKVVFTGQINDRLPCDLLLKVIRGAKDCQFYFVGTESLDSARRAVWKQILHLPNVMYVPTVPHAEIPAILKHADALLLPYEERGGEMMFPAKLFEYLAAAKPILATKDFSAGSMRLPTVKVCETAEAFIQALGTLCLEGLTVSAELRDECLTIAYANTWESRAAKFVELVQATAKRPK